MVIAPIISLNAQDLKADSLYIVTFTTGSSWDFSKRPDQQVYFKEHSANLSRMRKEGKIRLGARYADKGIIVIQQQTSILPKRL